MAGGAHLGKKWRQSVSYITTTQRLRSGSSDMPHGGGWRCGEGGLWRRASAAVVVLWSLGASCADDSELKTIVARLHHNKSFGGASSVIDVLVSELRHTSANPRVTFPPEVLGGLGAGVSGCKGPRFEIIDWACHFSCAVLGLLPVGLPQ